MQLFEVRAVLVTSQTVTWTLELADNASSDVAQSDVIKVLQLTLAPIHLLSLLGSPLLTSLT